MADPKPTASPAPAISANGSLPAWFVQIARPDLLHRIESQVRDGGEDHGGFPSPSTGWTTGVTVAFELGVLLGARCHADALSLDASDLDAAAVAAMSFLERRQAPDGRLDLRGAYTPNEAGFPLPALAAAYRHLPHQAPDLFDRLAPRLKSFMTRAAEALLNGHAYSANHRWVSIAAPLAVVHNLFPDERYPAKITDYLADGIDCDEDGFWYVERSSIYNMVANHAMLVLAEALDRPGLFDHALRSCRLATRMIQPNGEADTSFSFRQDRAEPCHAPAIYRIARRAAMLSGDGTLTTLAELVREETCLNRLMPMTLEWLDHPGDMPPTEPLPDRYEQFLGQGSIARWRDQGTAVTLTSDPGDHFFDTVLDPWGGYKRSEDWIHVHHRGVVLQSIRLELAEPAAIQPRNLETIGGGRYRLTGESAGWPHTVHFRPESPQITMPHRETHEVHVGIDAKGLDIQLTCDSPDILWATLRLHVREGVNVPGIGKLQAGDHHWWSGDEVALRGEEGAIVIRGLPVPQFTTTEPKPSKIRTARLSEHCACLSVAMRLPVDLHLRVELI